MEISIANKENGVDVTIEAGRQALLDWYDLNGRDLPWRVKGSDIANPYHVWLSEIMLQQTTVAHASRYFEKFILKWPTIKALANEEQDEVLANWAGLGYYARARNMLKCARLIVAEYNGRFPQSLQSLSALPGVGPYTAAAISSMAFANAANVVDGNIERIMSRLYAVETPLPQAKGELYNLAQQWVRQERARDWPQALMDLASLVCRPKAPLCHECPLYNVCKSVNSDPDAFPRRLPKAQKPKKYGDVAVITHLDSVWVERRSENGLLGGMLGLPHTEWMENHLENKNKKQMLFGCELELLGTYKHVFTHFELHQNVWFTVATEGEADRLKMTRARGHFMPLDNFEDLPTVFKKAVKLLIKHKRHGE